MSLIRVDNFGPSAGGTTYSARGIAKARVSFDATTATINNSINVSSLTDNSAGNFDINFTNAYATSLSYNVTTSGGAGGIHAFGNANASYTTYRTFDKTSPATGIDLTNNGYASFGDLA